MQSVQVHVKGKLKEELEVRNAEFSYNYPENAQESINVYGESVTKDLLWEAITLRLQAVARKALVAASAGADYSAVVSGIMANHRIDVKRSRSASMPKMSPYQQVARDLMDPTKKDELVALFRSLGVNLDVDGTGTPSEEVPASSGRRR